MAHPVCAEDGAGIGLGLDNKIVEDRPDDPERDLREIPGEAQEGYLDPLRFSRRAAGPESQSQVRASDGF